MDFKLLRNVVIILSRLMDSNNRFCSQCVNTHLNAPVQQTANTSIFREVLTLSHDPLIKCTWLQLWLLIPMKA